jgi:hypothetical protein
MARTVVYGFQTTISLATGNGTGGGSEKVTLSNEGVLTNLTIGFQVGGGPCFISAAAAVGDYTQALISNSWVRSDPNYGQPVVWEGRVELDRIQSSALSNYIAVFFRNDTGSTQTIYVTWIVELQR